MLPRILALALAATAVWLLSVLAGHGFPWRRRCWPVRCCSASGGPSRFRTLRSRPGRSAGRRSRASWLWPSWSCRPLRPGWAECQCRRPTDGSGSPSNRRRSRAGSPRGRGGFRRRHGRLVPDLPAQQEAGARHAARGRGFRLPAVVRCVPTGPCPSDEIFAYLAGFGRYGIPFDAVYGPGRAGGRDLARAADRDSPSWPRSAGGKAAGGLPKLAGP